MSASDAAVATGALARTARHRRPGRRQARVALARQPAARPARGRAGARSRAPHPRRAARGPRPDRHRRHRRGARRTGPAGCCVLFSSHQLDLVEDLCESVTIIDHGRLVVSGRVDDLATSGPRRLVVRVEGDREAAWARGLAGVTVSEVDRGAARLVLEHSVDSDAVLRAAMAAGRVTEFVIRAPPIVRGVPGGIGMKVVPWVVAVAAVALAIRRRRRRAMTGAAPSASPARAIVLPEFLGDTGLVAAREVRERIRGRVFRVVTLLILAGVAAAIVIPTSTGASSTPSRSGSSEPSPRRRAPPSSLPPRASGRTVHFVTEHGPRRRRSRSALRSGRPRHRRRPQGARGRTRRSRRPTPRPRRSSSRRCRTTLGVDEAFAASVSHPPRPLGARRRPSRFR